MVRVLTTTPVVLPRASLIPAFTPGSSAIPARGSVLVTTAA